MGRSIVRVAIRRGCRGASGKPPCFSAGIFISRGFSANYGPKGPGGNGGKRVPSGHNRRRRLATRSSGKQQAERTAVRAAPIVCPEESPPACSAERNLCRGSSPLAGPDAPTHRRKGRACNPMGRSIASGGDPKGVQGGERKATLHCVNRKQLCRKQFPLAGNDAPTPARGQGLQPYGALTLFFRWRKKSVQKKASGTATPGKRLLLPILTAGLAMSRAAQLGYQHLRSCALGARLFPPSKWAGLFPSAAYRRSAPAQLAAGRLTPCGLGCFDVAWIFLQRG